MLKAVLFTLLAAVPASETYTLPSYDFGNGGGSSSSSSYQLKSSVGSPGGSASSTNYTLPAGIRASTTAPTPAAPTFSNPNNSYDELKITLNVGGMPSDTKYAIAISDDNFVTTEYVQPDNTVGPTFNVANYQTYAAWGGASGFTVLDLQPNTTYKAKVAALHGSATGSPFGPLATTATVQPSVTFGVDTSLTPTPPFSASFTSLPPAQVTTANATINANLTTNAKQGGALLLRSQNAGLSSSLQSATIASATADLTAANTGYGAQITSAGQVSGGPLVPQSPFNGAGNNVGGLTQSLQSLATFASPITSGNLVLTLLAKASASTPAATDYADVLTLVVTLSF
jgi:hypothetical protein